MLKSKSGLICLLLASFLLCPIFGCAVQDADTGDSALLSVTFLDIGKGDCILISKDGKNVLIDTGYAATASEVLYFLAERGVEKLDALIVTHYDKDHAGGAADIINALETDMVWLCSYEGENKAYKNLISAIDSTGTESGLVTGDVTFTLSDVTFTIFASNVEYEPATDDSEGNDNDCSLVISAVYGDDSYLFAGDIEKAGIKAYLEAHSGNYDILKIPHHGGYEKNSENLLISVSPGFAVITDSIDEPADEALLDLLDTYRVKLYRSSKNGTVTFTGNGTGVYGITAE